MVDHASGEDVDLFLEEELFVDVKLRDQDVQQLARTLEARRQHQLALQRQAEQDEAKARELAAATGASASSTAAPAAAAQPAPAAASFSSVPRRVAVQSTPVTVSSLRRWHEAEIKRVEGRNVLVHFLEIPLPPQWLNVDEEHERLAELHVMTTLEREGRLNKKEALDLTVDADELFEEVIARCNVQHFYWAPTLRNGHRDHYEATLCAAREQFLQRWFVAPSASSSSSSSSSSSPPALCSDDVEMSDGSELYSESVSVPLFDPLTLSRITIPVRAASCQHLHCLDLMTHIQHQRSKLEWRCTCGQDAYANLLQVDFFVLHILRRLAPPSAASSSSSDCRIPHGYGEEPETRHVLVSRDGSWKVDDRDRERRNKRKREQPSPHSSSAISSSAPASSASPSPATSFASTWSSSSSSSSSLSAFFQLYRVSFPSLWVDGVEYVDLTADDPSDDRIRDWLMAAWQVKKERQQPDERKQPQAAPAAPSFILSRPVHSSSSVLLRASAHLRPPVRRQPGAPIHFLDPSQRRSSAAPTLGAAGPSFQRQQLPNTDVATATVAHLQSVAPSAQSAAATAARGPMLPPVSPVSTSILRAPPSAARSIQTSASSSSSAPAVAPAGRPRPSSSSIVVGPPSRPAPVPGPSEALNVNTCTEWQLKRAGFSYNISAAIIRARNDKGAFGFQAMDELRMIKGIGPKTHQKLKDKLHV